MDEQPSLVKDRMALADLIVQAELNRLVVLVTDKIRALPLSCRHEMADAGLASIWEEFKYQFQMENSTYTDHYEEHSRNFCDDAIASLTLGFQKLLWLWTDDFGELWVAKDEVKLNDWNRSAVVNLLYRMVCDAANNEPLAFDPGEAEARIRHEEDSQW